MFPTTLNLALLNLEFKKKEFEFDNLYLFKISELSNEVKTT